jgi:hypothetical protein
MFGMVDFCSAAFGIRHHEFYQRFLASPAFLREPTFASLVFQNSPGVFSQVEGIHAVAASRLLNAVRSRVKTPKVAELAGSHFAFLDDSRSFCI